MTAKQCIPVYVVKSRKGADTILCEIIGDFEKEQQKREIEAVLVPGGISEESIERVAEIFANELPIRSPKTDRIFRSIRSNSRWGAYGLPIDVLEYLYRRKLAIAELFGAPFDAVGLNEEALGHEVLLQILSDAFDEGWGFPVSRLKCDLPNFSKSLARIYRKSSED